MDDKYIQRAKKILNKILYITIATVSKDGQPWNSPVYSAFDKNYNFYWASDQNGQHSKNIAENDRIFLVIYDSTAPEGTGEGVYVQAKAFKLEDEKEIEHALSFLDGRVGKPPHDPKEFLGNKPRRVYQAVPEKFWINDDGEINGNYIDVRHEVKLLEK
jgi:nitroimidazol reductase NimA-like FMN-containing flavoprotein (pyridoxamine 5'-phosphate oxidase superfamily)